MAEIYDYFKTFSENYIKPFLENKKVTLILLTMVLSWCGYTGYGLLGLGESIRKITEITTEAKEVSKPLIMVEPKIVEHKVIIPEKVLQPIINYNGDSRVMKDHIEEYH